MSGPPPPPVPAASGQVLLDAIAEAAAQVSDAPDAWILRVEGDRLRLAARHGSRPPKTTDDTAPVRRTTAAGRALLDGRTVQVGADVATPMWLDGTPLGVIAIRRTTRRTLPSKQRAALEAFARQATLALRQLDVSTRELAESRAQQAAAGDILRAISSAPSDMQRVFDMVAENAVRRCDGQFGGVFRFDGERIHLVAQHGLSAEGSDVYARAFPRPPGRDSAMGRAILDRTIAHIPDVLRDPEYGLAALATTGSMRCIVAVPVLREGHPIGGIVAWRSRPEPFTERQVELLRTFADQTLIAVESARLVAALEGRNQELTEALEQQTATAEILRAISGSPTDLQPVLDTVVRAAARFCGAPDILLLRLDGAVLRGAAGLGPVHDTVVRQLGNLAALELSVTRGSVTGRAVVDRGVVHVHDLAHESADEFPEGRELARRFRHRTTMATPLLREGTPLGAIVLFRGVVEPFSDKQRELLRIFADQAAIAIENVRLFRELETRNRDLTETLEQQTATGEILRVISSSPTDVQPVFDTIADSAARLCEADFSVVMRLEGGLLHLVALNMSPEERVAYQSLFPRPPGHHFIVGRAVVDGRPVHIEDVQADPAYDPHTLEVLQRAAPYRTFLGVPILRNGVPIGAIGCGRRAVRSFLPAQIELVKTFADQAVIAIENVRLFTELDAKNRDLTETLEQQTATSDILRVISSSPTDVQPVFDTIAGNARRLCGAEFCAVFRFDGQLLHFVAHDGVTAEGVAAWRRLFPVAPGAGSGAGRAVLSGEVEQIPDVEADPHYSFGELARIVTFRSLVAVPILREGRPIGAITVNRSETGFLPARQIDLLKTFADQAIIAIENVRLFHELDAKNRDLTETLEQQTATAEILRVISSSPTDTQPVFDTIARNAVRLCQAAFAYVFRYDGTLMHVVAHHNLTAEALAALTRQWPMRPDPRSVPARAILDRRVVHVGDVLNEPDHPYLATSRALGIRTMLTVPMLREGQPIGAIAVYRQEVQAFSEHQIGLVATFASQAVIAIENVRLFQELEARNRDLSETLEQQTATGEILRVISSSPTDVQPVFDTIAESAKRLCGAEFCLLYRYDGTLLHFVAHHGLSPEGVDAVRRAYPMAPARTSAAARAVLSGALEHIPDVDADPDYGHGALARTIRYKGIVGVPMLRDGVPIGTIAVARVEARPFPDRQLELLKTFADQAVIAIENVRLFKELEAKNRDLTETLEQQTATSEILRVISRSPTNVEPVFDIIGERAEKLCDAAISVVSRFDGALLHLVSLHGVTGDGVAPIVSAFPMRPEDETASARAVRSRTVVHLPDVLTDARYEQKGAARAGGYRGCLAVPMLREGQVIGVIFVARTRPGLFTDTQVELLKTFADQAVIAVENVRLFQELQARTGDLTRSVGELRALGEVSQAVSSTLDLETVLETIVSRAVELSGSHSGIVYEFDEASQRFQVRATHQMTPEHLAAIRESPIRLGEGAIGRAGVIREPVPVSDIEAERQLVAPQVRDILARQGLRSLLALPLVREDRLLGGLVIIRREVGAFSPPVVQTMRALAAQSVLAIHNAGLFREIQRRKQYADAIVETSPVAIVTVDLGGRVVGWNPGAELLFGHGEAESLGRPMEDLVATPDVLEDVRDNLRRTLAGESIRAIGRRARKDGTAVDVEISLVPVVVDGARMGMIGIYHDITDLLRARREAEAANEAKSAFLATMSHEIRTPLNAVIGMSGLLLNTPLADEQREYAEIVRQSGDALLTVINDILDFSKIEAGRLELESQPFDLRECVEGALDLVATRAAEKGLDLAYVMGDGTPPVIVGDVTRLRQVLLNLLSNAVKFTERGEVVVAVSARRLDGPEGLHELTFSVRDTGIGIPPDRIGRLFQSFSQVDASTTRRYGGTGLGLAISQRLTELMGGRISVTSEVGAGSEFRFAIQAPAAEALPAQARRDLSGIQHSIRGKRVLVVDDNATNRRIVTTHLTTWGLPARATASPLEAVEWLRAGERFDLGILDMHMPEMDGVALARAIRAEPAGGALPLILFTSLGRREARAEEEGFAAYLHKPIKPSQLFDALVSVLGDQPVHVRERGVGRLELDPDMARRHPLRILLAEDNVVNQKVALRLLAQMGYRADVAANGLEAVDAVERQTYDVVLMDVQMPELDGFEASREINRRWPDSLRPRIVAMTANAMQGDRELCVAAGMDDYVAKPIRVEELVTALERTQRRTTAAAPGRPAAGSAGRSTTPAAPAASGGPAASPGSGALEPRETTTTDAIDRVTLDGLTRAMGGAFVAELIDTFVEDARELTAQLPAARARRDVDGFRRAAHSLKSTSESLGASALAALARDLEAIARAGSLDGVDERLGPVATEYARVAHALRKVRRDLTA